MRLLLGGSPCTYWSVAQKNNRETEASGLGWELFLNYVIELRQGDYDYFLYENNKSMAKPIRSQIDTEFNRPYAESPEWSLVWEQHSKDGHTARWTYQHTDGRDATITRILINSALVSAQNRQRYYWTNIPNVEQPEDRGILLKDVLESGVVDKEKSYCLKHQAGNSRDYFKKHHTQVAFEPTRIPEYGDNTKSRPVNALYPNHAGTGDGSLEQRLCSNNPNKQQVDLIAEPIRIGTIESGERSVKSDSQSKRVYSPFGKATTINANGGGVATLAIAGVMLAVNKIFKR